MNFMIFLSLTLMFLIALDDLLLSGRGTSDISGGPLRAFLSARISKDIS